MPGPRRKPWVAGLLSFIVPGLGQMYAGRLKRGIILWGIQFLAVLVFSLVSLTHLFPPPFNLALALLILVSFVFFVCLDAVLLSRRERDIYERKTYDKWYVYLTCAAVAMTIQYGAEELREAFLFEFRHFARV